MKLFLISLLTFLLPLLLGASERIVSLSPSLTEIIYALGKGEEIVGTTAYSLYPKEAQKLPIIGSYVSINIEKTLSLSPTLIIAQDFQKRDTAKLKKLGLKVMEVRLFSLDDIEQSIKNIATALHVEKKADELIATIESTKKSVRKAGGNKRGLIVYGLNENLKNNVYVAGKGIFYDDILTICGAKNAFTNANIAQPVLNYENLLLLNPDVILILHNKKSDHVDEKRALQKWYNLPVKAAKNRAIKVLDDDFISIPSHRVYKTMKRICEAL